MPRLSQRPARAVASAGDDAIEWAESIGWDADAGRGYYVLDEWQRFCVRGLLSEDSSAQLCALVVLIIVARQNGKNVILEVVELYAFFVLDLPYILHTAHLQETTADHMANLWAAIQSDTELAAITRQVVANGKERIYRTDWCAAGAKRFRCQIRFRTRSKKGGRGGSPQMVVFDEALHLLDKQINALLPSLAAQSMRGDAPILIYTSSAPVEESDVLRRVRAAILAGEIPDAFMAEWSASVEVQLGETREEALARIADDLEAFYEANPGAGVRIAYDWVRANERSTMSVEGYCVERLSVVLDEDHAVSALPSWASRVAGDEGSSIVSHRQWAITVSPDRKWSAIGVAGRNAAGRLHVEWVHHRAGTGWVVDQVAASYRTLKIPVRVHDQGPEGSLIPALIEKGVDVTSVSTADVAKATGQIIDAVDDGSLVHVDQPSLNEAVKGAVLRLTEQGASIWSQRSTKDITPLRAVTVAVGGVPAVLKPTPGIYADDEEVYA